MSRLVPMLLTAAVGLAVGMPDQAQAQSQAPNCVKRKDLLKQLEARFSEVPVAMGVSENGGVVEVFAAKDGATWTVTITMPNGFSCMLAAGEAWQDVPRVVFAGPPV